MIHLCCKKRASMCGWLTSKLLLCGIGGMADALDLGSSAPCVWVQVPHPAPLMPRNKKGVLGGKMRGRKQGLIHGLPFNYHLCGLNGH